jgi:PAS domain S-box-containing protein
LIFFFRSVFVATQHPDLAWISLVLLTVLASNFVFTLPATRGRKQSVSVAMGDFFVFFAILSFGPAVATITAVAEGFTMNLRTRVVGSYKQLFNLAQMALTAFLVAHMFYRIEGRTEPLEAGGEVALFTLLYELGFCAFVYFLLNTGIVSIAMVLTAGESGLRFWRENFTWAWVTQFAGATLAVFAFVFLGEFTFSMILVAPTVLLVYFAYKANLDRIKQTQSHLERTRELLTEKTQAEEALQQAKEELEIRVAQRTSDLSRANKYLTKEIGDRIQAEEALAAEKDRLAVTLRSIGDGVITTDTSGRVELVNAEAERLTGWTQDGANGKPLTEVFRIVDSKTGRVLRDISRNVLRTGRMVSPRSDSITLVSREGSERFIAHGASPIFSKSGKIVGTVLVFQDITDRKRMEDELLKAQKMESLGLLAGGIAHDFNNFLAAVLLKSQMGLRVLDQGRNPAQYLRSIEDVASEACEVTQQLLTFAKGGAPIKKAASIRNLLLEARKFSLRSTDVRFNFDVSEDLWDAEFDRGQMNQVINNLVVNGEQAMPGGGTLLIRAHNHQVDEFDQEFELSAGNYIRISVQDEGVGISAENLARVFEPYFTTKPDGHGLGLAGVYSIINRHGGRISVKSEVGKGTTFSFCLPAAAESAATEPEETAAALIRGSGRILVMDDDPLLQECAGELLQELGYDVVVVADGLEALNVYKQEAHHNRPFNAVILDLLVREGMGGKDTMRMLREFDPDVKAIVSSGYSSDTVMANPEKHGFSAVLNKPFTMEKLASVLDQATEGSSKAARRHAV